MHDGPGAFGELQDTLTLGCLKYVGSVQKTGKEHLLIEDDKGKVHVLGIGHYMGENSGMIAKIDAVYIYVRQIVNRHPDWNETAHPPFVSRSTRINYSEAQWEEVVVKFPKGANVE